MPLRLNGLKELNFAKFYGHSAVDRCGDYQNWNWCFTEAGESDGVFLPPQALLFQERPQSD